MFSSVYTYTHTQEPHNGKQMKRANAIPFLFIIHSNMSVVILLNDKVQSWKFKKKLYKFTTNRTRSFHLLIGYFIVTRSMYTGLKL